jgi:signal transduction histidine kinase
MIAESYVGTVLWSSKGQPIGLIAIIGRQPLANPKLAESMLKLVAVRAAGELERREAEEALRQRSLELQQLTETLEQRVLERTTELAATTDALRRLSTKLLSAQEDERKRIAGDLHDTIGSCLNAVKFKVKTVQQQIGNTANVTSDALNTIIPIVQESIDECRRIQMDLRPSMLDDLGILPTIVWRCREFRKTYSHIRIENQIDIAEDNVPVSLKTVIYRVLQEALNNTAKHSKADLIHLSLRKTENRIELIIQDNGQGFDQDQVFSKGRSGKGFGLTSMRERTELSGGSFSIESSKGAGTVIQAAWLLDR